MGETGRCTLRPRGRAGLCVWMGPKGAPGRASVGAAIVLSMPHVWLEGEAGGCVEGGKQAAWRGGADPKGPGTWGPGVGGEVGAGMPRGRRCSDLIVLLTELEINGPLREERQ